MKLGGQVARFVESSKRYGTARGVTTLRGEPHDEAGDLKAAHPDPESAINLPYLRFGASRRILSGPAGVDGLTSVTT